jgi:hypothetical protein
MVTTTVPLIGRIQQTTAFSSTGQPIVSYVVSFTIGEQGPFSITIPQGEFDAAEVLKRVDAFATTIAAITVARGT